VTDPGQRRKSDRRTRQKKSGDGSGYQEAREALADPNHERHDELSEWWSADRLLVDTIDIAAIDADLAKLARRWTRKPRAKKK
jgi:hypothetical protein